MTTCKAELYIADDHGDNHATMNCQLSEDHEGPHKEEFPRSEKPVIVTWEVDEREFEMKIIGVKPSDVDSTSCLVKMECSKCGEWFIETLADAETVKCLCGNERFIEFNKKQALGILRRHNDPEQEWGSEKALVSIQRLSIEGRWKY